MIKSYPHLKLFVHGLEKEYKRSLSPRYISEWINLNIKL